MNTTATRTRISLKHILYATDFSPAAEAALPYVKELSNQYGATVRALHVRLLSAYPIVGPEAMPQFIEAAEEQTKFEAQQLHEMLAGVPHDVSVGEGDLWPTMTEMVQQKNIDLIVIGTHGRACVRAKGPARFRGRGDFSARPMPGPDGWPAHFQGHETPPGNEADSVCD